MGDILIRNLDEETISALKLRARENGRSLQAELHAELLRLAREKTEQQSLARLRRIRDRFDTGKLPGDFWDRIGAEADDRP